MSHIDPNDEEMIAPRIRVLLDITQTAIDVVAEAHRTIADWDGVGGQVRTREIATLESVGHCLSLSNALVDQLRQHHGYTTLPTVRALHEATMLLSVLASPHQEELRQRWFDGKGIPHASVRRAMRQAEGNIHREQKLLKRIDLSRHNIYEFLSVGSHPSRLMALSALARQDSQQPYGPRGISSEWEAAVALAVGITKLALHQCGLYLGALFLGYEFPSRILKPHLDAMTAAQTVLPSGAFAAAHAAQIEREDAER